MSATNKSGNHIAAPWAAPVLRALDPTLRRELWR